MQNTMVRTKFSGMPDDRECVDCRDVVALVDAAGYGQDDQYPATEVRAGRDVCGLHAQMHDDLAAEIAAEEAAEAFEDDRLLDDDLLALVEATVWATDPRVVLDEIDAVWAVAS